MIRFLIRSFGWILLVYALVIVANMISLLGEGVGASGVTTNIMFSVLAGFFAAGWYELKDYE